MSSHLYSSRADLTHKQSRGPSPVVANWSCARCGGIFSISTSRKGINLGGGRLWVCKEGCKK